MIVTRQNQESVQSSGFDKNTIGWTNKIWKNGAYPNRIAFWREHC